jgi:hypothetical protein
MILEIKFLTRLVPVQFEDQIHSVGFKCPPAFVNGIFVRFEVVLMMVTLKLLSSGM